MPRELHPLTMVQLRNAACTLASCDHLSHGTSLVLRATCHITAGLEVELQDAALHVRCKTCKKPVTAIRVAEQ